MGSTSASCLPLQQSLLSGAVLLHWPCLSPTPTALLFLQHGFGDYSERMIRDYPYVLSDLHALDIDVWAMDMYAHGKSAGDPRAVADVNNLVADHISARQTLLSHPRSQITSDDDIPTYRPLFLLGHSLGGLVTASSASQDQKHIRGVILSAPALTHPAMISIKRFVSFLSSFMPATRIPLPMSTPDQLTRNKVQLTTWYADKAVYHGQISFLIAASALETADTLFKKVNDWTVPVLVTHGDKDGFTDHGQSQRFVDMVKVADKEFYSVKDGRHDLFSDDAFEAVWKHVLNWIEGRIA